jgi:plasmid stabilization system protein ParE
MRVRWTTDAADDLERICDYVAESRPDAARRVAQSVVERIGTLKTFPNLGRDGRVQGTREITFLRSHSWRFTRFLRSDVKSGCSVSCTVPNSGHHVSGNALRLSGDVIFSRGVPMRRWAQH